jgi:hypothetical protein
MPVFLLASSSKGLDTEVDCEGSEDRFGKPWPDVKLAPADMTRPQTTAKRLRATTDRYKCIFLFCSTQRQAEFAVVERCRVVAKRFIFTSDPLFNEKFCVVPGALIIMQAGPLAQRKK